MFSMGSEVTLPPMVSVFNYWLGWVDESVSSAPPASATYETANLAVYYPLFLPVPCVVRRVWWANGATVAGGATIEVGVYASSDYGPGAKLVSGSAVQGDATSVQFVDVTDTSLPVGVYWIAISSSSATNTTIMRATIGGAPIDAGMRYQEASASPLPATATPVESTPTGTSNIYLCGFATTATP